MKTLALISFSDRLKAYAALTKPGIIGGNAVTALGGMALATEQVWNGWLALWVIIGLSGIIGSACALNNYIDRVLDQKMVRTQGRPLAVGKIAPVQALIFATILGWSGVAILGWIAPLALWMALIGFVVYTLGYSFLKYRSAYATWVGSIAGAMPPVVGYCAVSGRFDGAAAIVFVMLVFWQMAHFFSIALYRLIDYREAEIPVWPVEKGVYATKVQIGIFIVLFTGAALLLTLFGYTSWIYAICMIGTGFVWLRAGLQEIMRPSLQSRDARWGRRMFLWSLLAINISVGCLFIDMRF